MMFPTGKIGELVTPVRSWSPARESPGRLITYIDLSSVDNSTKTITPNPPILADVAPSRARQLVQSDDILVSTVRPNLNGVCRLPRELDGATASTGFCVLRPDPRKVLASYLFHWVKGPCFISDMTRKATGASYPAVSDRIIFDAVIPLPPMPEQQRIAAVLDQVDELRRKRRYALERVGSLLESLFSDLRTSEMPVISIGSAVDEGILLLHKDGNHGSLYPRADDFGSEGVAFVSAKSITEGGYIEDMLTERLREAKAESLRHGWIDSGDVLLAHNATVGKVGLYRGEYTKAIVGTSLTVFRPDSNRLLPEFLFCALKSRDFQTQLKRNMGQTTRNQVPITAQKSLRFPIPDITLQRVFVERYSLVDAIWKRGRTQLSKLNTLFDTLQRRAFNGDLVPEPTPIRGI